MLDIKFIRENPDLVKEAAKKKRIEFDINKLLETDDKRRELLQEVEDLRAKQNKASDEVKVMTEETEKNKAISNLRELKDALAKDERQLKKINEEWKALMYDVPNIPDPSVPEGGERDAREEKRWGSVKDFLYPAKNHVELMRSLDLADLERGAKVSGFRGYFLKNEAAVLSQALWAFSMDKIRAKGYAPIFTPSLVREENLLGSGHFPQSREDVYKLADDDLYLSATAEVPLMGYYSNETLNENDLPKKFIAFSPCFRREAGSYGKDTKGIYRVHEFFKIEQLILGVADHQNSVELHEELTSNSEEILQELNIPYRVTTLAGGDIGRAHVKTYDIEVWIPSEKRYRESHSSSYYHDFQTRRLNIRYKTKDGKTKFCYSLNDTAIATPRILIALLENYQQSDGSVKIPEVLQKYTGFNAITNNQNTTT